MFFLGVPWARLGGGRGERGWRCVSARRRGLETESGVGSRRGDAGRRLSSNVACEWSTKSSTAGTDSRADALCMPCDRGKVGSLERVLDVPNAPVCEVEPLCRASNQFWSQHTTLPDMFFLQHALVNLFMETHKVICEFVISCWQLWRHEDGLLPDGRSFL